MSNYPKDVALNDGSRVIVRELAPGDRSALERFFKRLPEQDREYLRRDVTDPRVLDAIVLETAQDNSVWLVAERGGQIIGEGSLTHPGVGWKRKIGEMRLIIDNEHQHGGLGSVIARELFVCAVQMQLDKVCVSVAEEQEAAVRCVEKLGFKREGVLKNYIIDNKDKLHNMVVMTLEI